MEIGFRIDDDLVIKTLKELETSIPRELFDPTCAKMIIDQIGTISTEEECECKKKAVVRALLASTWTQRLYFVVRSAIISLISAAIMLATIWYVGSINVTQGFFLGIFAFVSSLFISRLFDSPITVLTKKILKRLSNHRKLLELMWKNL